MLKILQGNRCSNFERLWLSIFVPGHAGSKMSFLGRFWSKMSFGIYSWRLRYAINAFYGV